MICLKITRSTLLIIGSAACALPAGAQALHRPVQLPATLGGIQGVVSIVGTELRWCVAGQNQVVQLPFAEVTCGVAVGIEFLAFGRTSTGDTRVVRISEENRSLRVAAERDYAMWVAGAEYDAVNDALFLMEEKYGAIFAVPPRALPPSLDPTTAIATIPNCWRIAWVDRQVGGLCLGVPERYTRLYRQGMQWRQESVRAEGHLLPVADVTRPPTTSGPVHISLGGSGPIALQLANGTLIALGQGTTGSRSYDLPQGVRLDPFVDYRLRGTLDGHLVTSGWFAPRIRVGGVFSTGIVTAMSALDGNANQCHVGSGFFVASGHYTLTKVPSEMRVLVWTRLVDPTAPPPVFERNGRVWLLPADGLSVPTTVTTVDPTDFAVAILIPNDQALGGKMLYMQSCVLGIDGSGVTDVCALGVSVRPRGRFSIPPTRTLEDYTARHAVSSAFVDKVITRLSGNSRR